jgi:hypothetical protein
MTDIPDKVLFIEEKIINSLKKLLSGQVNELLGEMEYPIPPIEFGQSGFTGLSSEFWQGRNSMAPIISLSSCERSEKERIVRLDAYTLTIAFTVPEWPSGQRSVGERNCYAYAALVAAALKENPTLGGIANWVEFTGKKYVPPKQGGDWELVLSLRATVEGGGYAGA